MPGGASGYTDVYLCKGDWNGGTNQTFTSSDLYPILSNIKNVTFEIHTNTPYAQTFGESSQQSYRDVLCGPPGRQQATFHVTLKQV
jgi:hypothetical protein